MSGTSGRLGWLLGVVPILLRDLTKLPQIRKNEHFNPQKNA